MTAAELSYFRPDDEHLSYVSIVVPELCAEFRGVAQALVVNVASLR